MKMVNENLIKKWEKLRLVAYLPTPDDVWTIGWGHTLGVKKGDKITKEQAQEFFIQDKQWAEDAVNQKVKVPLTQEQFDALVSLVFNIGANAFSRSTLLKKLNRKDYQGAADQFNVWVKQKGKTLTGLVRRRAEERSYFLSGMSKEGPASASVDKQPGSFLNTENVAGAGAAIAGLGSLAANVQLIAVVALIALGVFILWRKYRNG